MKKPSISIVMPCLNRAAFVSEAIESIYTQGIPGIEVVVADGGSTDGTLEILARRPETRVLVGRDSGVYEALNKAIAASTGDIVGHLNTDDVYLPGALAAVLDAFEADPQLQMVCGGAELAEQSSDGSWRVIDRFPATEYAELTWPLVLKGPILTNARFYRRELLMRCGPFDQSYKLIADRVFLINVLEAAPRTAALALPVLQYRQHPGSLTFNENPRAMWKGLREKFRLAEERFTALEQGSNASLKYRDWGRHEAFIAVLLALRCRSVSDLIEAMKAGRRFGPGWWRYLAGKLLTRVTDQLGWPSNA